MKEVLTKILDKIELKIIIRTLYFVAIIFTFVSDNYIEKMGLLEFKNNWKFVISIILIILTCYYIAIIIEAIISFIKDKRESKLLRKLMTKLTPEEKQYLVMFYDKEQKMLETTHLFDISNATVNLLVAKNIIARGSSIARSYTAFDYYLQPWAYEYLNKKIEQGKLIIEEGKFTWYD